MVVTNERGGRTAREHTVFTGTVQEVEVSDIRWSRWTSSGDGCLFMRCIAIVDVGLLIVCSVRIEVHWQNNAFQSPLLSNAK